VIEVRQLLEMSDFPADMKEASVKLDEQLFGPKTALPKNSSTY